MKRTFFAFALTAVFFASGASSAFAQVFEQSNISLSLSPEHPKAGEHVTATVSANSFDINAANISWQVNGKPILQGIGAKELQIPAASRGETDIQAHIETADWSGDLAASFDPSLVSLAWQSPSYVPPFYRGKALFPTEGALTLVALPFFSRAGSSLGSTDQISYDWTKDGQVVGDQSGFGRSTFSVKAGLIDEPVRVGVTAHDITTGQTGYDEVVVHSSPAILALYENHPLNGIMLNKAFGATVSLADPEISLFAAPFSESLSALPSLRFAWTMNGGPLDEKTGNITLRAKDGVSGTSTVSLTVTNPAEVTQDSSASVGLVYALPAASGFNAFK